MTDELTGFCVLHCPLSLSLTFFGAKILMNLLAVLDQEAPFGVDHLGEIILKVGPKTRVAFEGLGSGRGRHRRGYFERSLLVYIQD